jgi:hypothetical protein
VPGTQGGSWRLPGGGRSPAEPVSGAFEFPANRENKPEFSPFWSVFRF